MVSLKITYCTVLTLVTMWDDDMPVWWDEARWVTPSLWCRQHSAGNLLTTDLKEDRGLPYRSWLRVTAESETPDKGTTVWNNVVLFNKHIKNVYMQRDSVWKTVVLTSLRTFFNFHFYLHKIKWIPVPFFWRTCSCCWVLLAKIIFTSHLGQFIWLPSGQ